MSVTQEADSQRQPAGRKRRRFVKVRTIVPSELDIWLPLFAKSRQAAEGSLLTFLRLLTEVNWRTGEWRGSDTELAALLNIDRKTLSTRIHVLEAAEVVERVGTARNGDTRDAAGVKIPEAVWNWTQEGGPFPVFARFLEGTRRVTREQVAGGNSPQHLGNPSAAPGETLPSTGGNSPQVDPASPGQTDPSEVQTSKTPQTEEVVRRLGSITEEPALIDGDGVRVQIERLLPGWGADGIVQKFGAAWGRHQLRISQGQAEPVRSASWVAAVLRDWPNQSPQQEQQVERQRQQDRQSAPECEHRVPNGTWRNKHGKSPCVECNGQSIKDRSA